MSLSCLILGSTGETGKHVLLSALANPTFKTVHALGRKPPSVDATAPGFEKLITTPSLNFDSLLSGDGAEALKLKVIDSDVVLVTLGTTRAAAGSAEAFVKIDREYVLAAAKAARIGDKSQKVVYCSSGGASSGSSFLYPKSKGLTEEGLAAIGYSECIIFRPGMLIVPGGRAEHRVVETIAAKVTGLLSYLSPSIQIQTPLLGAAIVRAGVEGVEALAKQGLAKKEDLKGHEAWFVANKEAALLGASV